MPPRPGDYCTPLFNASEKVLEAAGGLRPTYQALADQLRDLALELDREGWKVHERSCNRVGRPKHGEAQT